MTHRQDAQCSETRAVVHRAVWRADRRVGVMVAAAVVGAFALLHPLPAVAHEAVGPAHCQPLPAVQAWLDLHIVKWDAILATEPGYERPSSVTVCAAPPGRPFADNRANRIFVRGIETVDQQITVAHEYVHIAFQHYPSGHNEGYVEHTARRLIAEFP